MRLALLGLAATPGERLAACCINLVQALRLSEYLCRTVIIFIQTFLVKKNLQMRQLYLKAECALCRPYRVAKCCVRYEGHLYVHTVSSR